MTTFIDLSEYQDPRLYDLENRDFEPDGTFLLERAQRLGGRVLELGCGTGRITIPLAQKGIDIIGLDLAPEMLARARQKAAGLPIQWIEADVRSFHLPHHFRLIFETGSVFMHMLERSDQEAFLGRVHEHLADGGQFITNLFFPHPDALESVEVEQDWFSYEDESGRMVRVSGVEVYDPLRQVKLETAFRRWTEPDGREVEQVAPLSLRYTFPQEMETLLYYNGFTVLERYGGWMEEPLAAESRLIVYVCKKSKPLIEV